MMMFDNTEKFYLKKASETFIVTHIEDAQNDDENRVIFFCSILFRTIDNLHICMHDNFSLFFC